MASDLANPRLAGKEAAAVRYRTRCLQSVGQRWWKLTRPRGEAHGGCPGVDGAKPRQDDRSEGGRRLDRRPTHRRGAQEGTDGAAHAEVPARGTGAAVPRRGHVGAGVAAPRVSGRWTTASARQRCSRCATPSSARTSPTGLLFAVDVDPAKLARRLRAGQPRAKTDAWLGEAGGAFYDAALDRCCKLYVRAVEQVPAFVGRSLAEMLNRLSDLPDQVAARVVNALGEAQAAVADPDGGVTVAGRPLEEVTDPFVLEVHRPVQPDGCAAGAAAPAAVCAARA